MKRIILILLVLPAAFIFTGCAKLILRGIDYDVVRVRGDYGGNAVYELKNNNLMTVAEKDCWSPFCISGFQFNFRKYIVDNKTKLFLVMGYNQDQYSYMQNVDKLVVTADGKQYTFTASTKESKAEAGAGTGAGETKQSYYDVDREQIFRLGIAKDATLRIVSKWYDTELYFSSNNLVNIKLFYFGYLKGK